jgi:signal transduction histidine kinase
MIAAQDLRSIAIFSDLPEEQLAWFAQQGEDLRVEPGAILFRQGDPADRMFVFLEGEFEGRSERAGDGQFFRARAGDVTGLLPFSRLQKFQGTGRAVTQVRVALFHKSLFPEMLQRMPVLAERLVALMLDRVRDSTKTSEQRDKLAALGKLSAGLAHELNNPAAAVKRAATALWDVRKELRAAYLRLDQRDLTREQRIYIAECEESALALIHNPPAPLTPVQRGDREQELEDWMEARSVPEPWKIAPTLAEAEFDPARLAAIAGKVGMGALHDVLLRINYSLVAARMVEEIRHGATRISDLVQAVKEYTYMDQGAEQDIDIHAGIDSTLVILAYKLRNKSIQVEREYASGLPKVCAFGAELNQVWTNLIANAIEAMPVGGRLRIRTCQDPRDIVVEIEDSGSGIPQDVLPHIFEPFFTTKGVGEGTGLGLDTVMRIIRKHRGEIRVQSQPGATTFRVGIPKLVSTAVASQPSS